MPHGRQRTLQDIQTFVRSKKSSRSLYFKLRRDLQNLKIVKEADAECAIYYHLRRYIGEDPKWRVLARRYVKCTGHYVDLLIFKNTKPAIALELKWGNADLEKKDRKSLYLAITRLKVQKAYWISVFWSDEIKKHFRKRPKEKYSFHRVIVRLGLKGKELEEYKEKREKFRSEMLIGRGRK